MEVTSRPLRGVICLCRNDQRSSSSAASVSPRFYGGLAKNKPADLRSYNSSRYVATRSTTSETPKNLRCCVEPAVKCSLHLPSSIRIVVLIPQPRHLSLEVGVFDAVPDGRSVDESPAIIMNGHAVGQRSGRREFSTTAGIERAIQGCLGVGGLRGHLRYGTEQQQEQQGESHFHGCSSLYRKIRRRSLSALTSPLPVFCGKPAGCCRQLNERRLEVTLRESRTIPSSSIP